MVYHQPPTNFSLDVPSIQSLSTEFFIFLNASSDTVMDHITFMYTHKLVIEATLEQYDKPLARILTSYGIVDGTQQVEQLIKPTSFTIE